MASFCVIAIQCCQSTAFLSNKTASPSFDPPIYWRCSGEGEWTFGLAHQGRMMSGVNGGYQRETLSGSRLGMVEFNPGRGSSQELGTFLLVDDQPDLPHHRVLVF